MIRRHICLFEGKPTDFNYNNGTTLVNGSSTNSMMNNNAANAGRTNFTNKQLTVRRKFRTTNRKRKEFDWTFRNWKKNFILVVI
jgi:hypothetical protein